jgi:hypothetical protein
MEYLGCMLTRTGIKSQPNKVQAILTIALPKQVKDLHRFLGMIQYYRQDIVKCLPTPLFERRVQPYESHQSQENPEAWLVLG